MCGFCELRSSSPAGALLGHVAEPCTGACSGRAAFLPSTRSLGPALAAAVPAVPCEGLCFDTWDTGKRAAGQSGTALGTSTGEVSPAWGIWPGACLWRDFSLPQPRTTAISGTVFYNHFLSHDMKLFCASIVLLNHVNLNN